LLITGGKQFRGKYIGKKPPGPKPELFDHGEITGDHRLFNISFSPNNKELFFSYNKTAPDYKGPAYEIKYMKRVKNVWNGPDTYFSGKYADADITFSPDGKRVFFASDRPHPKSADMDIYYLEKSGDSWSKPIYAGIEVNTVHNEVYPTFSLKGNLFFASNRPGGYGDKDIYRAELKNGLFTNVKNLGEAINTEHLESDCFIAPDESYILFNTSRPENKKRIHIYISFQNCRGKWTKAVKLPEIINVKGEHTGFPTITSDGKYLFYSAHRGGKRCIYWVSTELITNLKKSYRDSV
jgi:Tol biopolymer transport system component